MASPLQTLVLLALALALLPGFSAATPGHGAAFPPAAHSGPLSPSSSPGDRSGGALTLGGEAPPYYLGGHIPPVYVPAPGTPVPATVNPKALYSSEPAPMGLGDFGLTSGGSAYTYYTHRFVASAHLGSLSIGPVSASTGNSTSLQLNVVVTMSRGSQLAEYWIQDVPIYDAATHYIYLENNVWNFSGGNTLPSGSVSGNGSVYKSGNYQYYADGPSSSYAGNDVYLTPPVNISVEVTAYNLSGYTHVGFLYDDGSGWVIYDNVTFPYTKGWTFHGFEVNGSAYNPFGTFDDAEWVIAGPGGGSEDKDLGSDLNLTLDYDNGRNLESVPNAYDFGSDTAETVTNANPGFPTRAPTGAPADRFQSGSGSLAFLFGSAKVAIVNVTAPVNDGTLLVNGTPTPYRGGRLANLTVVPGTYRFADENGSKVVASRNVTVTAGEYLALSFAEARIAPSSARSQANVTANGTGFASGSTVSVLWPGNQTAQCNGSVAKNGSFGCSFKVPITANGTYTLTAQDNAATVDRTTFPFVVTTNLTLVASASLRESETNWPVHFQANASSGFPPYATYSWRFGDGTTLSSVTNSVNNTYTRAGNYTVNVTVTDHVGSTASAELPIEVIPTVTAARPSASRASADVGEIATFSTAASAGLGPYNFSWRGLPIECSPSGARASCSAFQVAGNYSISVQVTDALGFAALSATLPFEVFDAPTIASVSASPGFVDVGGNLTLTATGDPGAGRLKYNWTGLPPGCAGTGPVISCQPNATGPFTASVSAVDANGIVTGIGRLPITIYPDPVVVLSAAGPIGRDAAQTLNLSAVVIGGAGAASFAWSGLPPGCNPGNSSRLVCLVGIAGGWNLLLTFTDRAGWVATASVNLLVAPTLTASWVSGPGAPVDPGTPISFDLAPAGGSGGLLYTWSGLPSGCATENRPTLTCTPEVAGSYQVGVSARDTNGALAHPPLFNLTVNPLPSFASFVASPGSVLEGQGLSLNARTSGGTGPWSYHWSGLPPGCAASVGPNLTCSPTGSGQFTIELTATDSFHRSTNGSVRVTVVAPVLGLPPWEGYGLLVAASLGAVAVAAAAVVARRRLRRTDGSASSAPAPPAR